MAEFRSLADLAETTQDELLPGIIDSLKKNDEFTNAIISNAVVTDRPTVKGNRLVSEGSAQYIDCNSTLVSEAISGAPFDYDLKTILRQFDVCKTGQNLYSSFTDVVGAELNGALKAVGNQIAADVVTGNGTTEIAGLETQNTNSFGTAGSSFAVGDLDRLYDEVLSRENLVYFGAPATIRAALAEIRAEAGGLEYSTLAGTELRVPSYLGIPMLRNQYAPTDKIYLLDLAQFRLFVGESDSMNVGGIFGLDDVGLVQDKHARRWRVYTQVASVLLDTQASAELDIS